MEQIVEYVRLMSQHGRVVTAEQAAALAGVELGEDIPAQHQQLIEQAQYQDLVLTVTQDKHYLYSNQIMADSFAAQCIAVDCDDALQAMTAEIRRFSELGELLPANSFSYPPYQLDTTQLSEHCSQLCLQDDIELVTGNDDERYLFSTEHITATYAEVLANFDPFEYSA